MSYIPTTDFLALLRQTAGAVELARMPGLDFAVAALARAGMFKLWVGQSAPVANQVTTVWLKPALPSWTAEGNIFLYNVSTAAYELATPALWDVLLSPPSAYVFQSVGVPADVVKNGTTLLAVQRTTPDVTALVLPALANRNGQPLRVVDWSLAVVNHVITLTTPDGATIMRQLSWLLYSTPDQLSGVTLHPSTDLNGWVIAP